MFCAFSWYLKCTTQLKKRSIQISHSIHKAELNLNHCLPSHLIHLLIHFSFTVLRKCSIAIVTKKLYQIRSSQKQPFYYTQIPCKQNILSSTNHTQNITDVTPPTPIHFSSIPSFFPQLQAQQHTSLCL